MSARPNTLVGGALTLSGARPETAYTAADFARVKAPVLFLWGRFDAFGGPDPLERARAVRPALAAEIVEEGHLPWIDDALACGGAIRSFLATARRPGEDAHHGSEHPRGTGVSSGSSNQ